MTAVDDYHFLANILSVKSHHEINKINDQFTCKKIGLIGLKFLPDLYTICTRSSRLQPYSSNIRLQPDLVR